MKVTQRAVAIAVVALSVLGSSFFVVHTISANTVTSSVVVGNAVPTVPTVTLNGGASITLIASTTKAVDVFAIITDNNGCSDLIGGTTSIALFRTSITSSTCISSSSPNPLLCYNASAFTASSTCSGATSINTTTTFNVQYFANATDASSSYSTDSWVATVRFTDPSLATGTRDSATTTLNSLTAINITTSSINYGTQAANSDTGSVNQTTTVTNAGNSTSTLNLSGTALFSGANSISTSSQHYSTSTFTYAGTSTALSGTAVSVTGFKLNPPGSLTPVTQNVFWGLSIPGGTPTGTYNGTTTFTSVWTGS